MMKRLLLWTGIVVATIVAILLGINAYWVWSSGARLEAQLAELRAAGEPIALADLARPPIPPEKNAATYLRRAQSDLEAIQKELLALHPEKNRLPTEPLRPDEREKLQKLFDAYPNVVPLLEQAAACPDYDPQLDFTVPAQELIAGGFEHVHKHRLSARTLRARTTLLLASGRGDDALGGMILLLRLCRHFEHAPMIIGHLVANACRGTAIEGANAVLQSGAVSQASREALERELARYDAVQAHIAAIKSERAVGLDMFRELPWDQYGFTRGLSYSAQTHYLDMMREQLEAASKPYREAAALAVKPPRQFRFAPHVLADLVRPALNAARISTENNLATVRALRVINALQAKVAPDAGQSPKLSELGLPADAITDPFSGEPLRVKKLPQGWLVYSVGQNLADDGGTLGFDAKSDVGLGPLKSL